MRVLASGIVFCGRIAALGSYGCNAAGDFTYQLGAAGNRTNLVDNVSGTNRTFSWSYDNLYRLTSESVSNASPTGTLGYVYDDVGNRTSRTGTLGSLSATNNTFDVNDWLDNDSITNNANAYFDANGNQRTNGTIYYGYDLAKSADDLYKRFNCGDRCV